MERLFFATVAMSVITVALVIRALVLRRWASLRTVLLFMLIGGAVGYVATMHGGVSVFREHLLGILIRSDVLYVYLCVVVAGLLGFLLSSLSDGRGAQR